MAGRSGVYVENPKSLTKMGETTELFLQATFVAGRKEAIRLASEMELWAKDNAPWQNVTGKAREGLKGWVDPSGGPIGTIVLQHNPELHYTIWLELAHQGRYAILTPARDYWGPKIRVSLQRLANLGYVTLGEEE